MTHGILAYLKIKNDTLDVGVMTILLLMTVIKLHEVLNFEARYKFKYNNFELSEQDDN